MAIKVKKTHSTAVKTSSEIDLFDGIKLPNAAKKKVAKEVGELLIDATLLKVGNQKSPIEGLGWSKLSKKYKAFKLSKNRPGEANIEFSGKTLDAYKAKVKSNGILEMGVFGNKTAPIADGHNNLSGKSSLPLRRWLPDKGDTYKGDIQSDVDSIIREAVAKNAKLPKNKLRGVTSKNELLDILEDTFPGSSESQIIDAIIAEPALLDELSDLGLLELLNI